jgi:general secretion pathway protein K
MRRHTCGTRRQQQGLALITAVLIVAIVATVATTLALGEQVWLRQAQNLNDRAQAESLLQGALGYAAILLARDAAQSQTDNLGELWAKPLPPLPVENGMIAFAVTDAQSRFNLNNLVQTAAPNTENIKMFRNLLTALRLDPNLSDALRDWIDPNSNTRSGGAVDTEYLNLPQPYRAANQPLSSVDELRLVKGFTADIVEKLRPYVIALPGPVATPVNVNTAGEQVLAALFVDPPAAAVLQPLLDGRATKPIENAALFAQALPPGTKLLQQSLYDVKSSYFLVTIDIRIGRLQRRTEALIQRVAGKTGKVLWHQLPPLQLKMSADEKT